MLDFDSDACLMIWEPEVFQQRLKSATEKSLPNWHFEVKSVEYYDPVRLNPKEIDLIWCKHFRYAYQHEVRLAAIPPKPINRLGLLEKISVGNLENIAELVVPTVPD